MEVMAGKGKVFASQMQDSSDLLARMQSSELRNRLDRDGYLLLRSVLPREQILAARSAALEQLAQLRPEVFAPGTNAAEGRAAPGASSLGLLDQQQIAHSEEVADVLHHPILFDLASHLLQGADVITTGYKWLRAVGRGEFTGVHTDRVFLGRGAENLITIWLPIGDVPVRARQHLQLSGLSAPPWWDGGSQWCA
ncbi:hypothetical protein CYMTET_26918 [Cymbomonas tetramitiformis]|uniref:Uncharacterized protein n=1 Tax=Cymbomonas tetramitiformis TaxID=36881 RepID=A0AAE0FR44_9CHLO|nr:hypothetical protein CYMTET_26918 [Cymbomonas tetramitiformis]